MNYILLVLIVAFYSIAVLWFWLEYKFKKDARKEWDDFVARNRQNHKKLERQ